MSEQSSDSSPPFKFELKDAPNAQATPVGVGADGVQDETGNPPLQVYRFKLRTKDGLTQPAAIAVAQAALEVSDLRWESQELEHGTETVMSAKIAGYDGGQVRFVVEHDHDGWWKPFATVPATVEKGVATAKLLVHHPVLPPAGSTPSASKLQGAKDAQLRFYVERGPAEPQKKADPGRVVASTKPKPNTEVGTLSVKGAFAGEAFFVLNAKGTPVHATADGPVKTTATAVNGFMFLLGKDRGATFENLPAGKYQVVFPPEEEGSKPPEVAANADGAHVVDVKDFVTRGAACQVEVAKGSTLSLELTLSADGTAHVCC